ncbi:MAG: hypothetical protein ABIQ32_04910 [Sphingomicrobium sp.]
MFAGAMFLMTAQVAAAPAAASTAPPTDSARSVYGPALPAAPKPVKPAAPIEPCRTAVPKDPGEIIVCAERPQGYRLDADVLTAKRARRGGGKPKRPDRMADTSCQVVGPMGCRNGPAVNLVAAALTAAKMAERLSKGQEIGSMFITTPESTEYQLYIAAKREREAREAEAAAAAAAKAAKTAPAAP